MTDQSDPGQPPPNEPPPSSPFPESSLGEQPEAPVPPPVPAPPPAQEPPPAAPADPGLWAGPQPPEPPAPPPAPAPPAPVAPPASPSGLSSGDPLAGAYPEGYSTAPPPGAGGAPPIAGLGTSALGSLPGQFVLSGWWRRVGAALIDGLIIGVIGLGLMGALGVGYFSTDFENASSDDIAALVGAFIVAALIFGAVALAYAPVMMGATNGKTLGRMVTGIRVVRVNGQSMTFGWAALREVVVKQVLIAGIASSFTFGLAYVLDVLWPLWDDENRALHDFVVGTRTIRD